MASTTTIQLEGEAGYTPLRKLFCGHSGVSGVTAAPPARGTRAARAHLGADQALLPRVHGGQVELAHGLAAQVEVQALGGDRELEGHGLVSLRHGGDLPVAPAGTAGPWARGRPHPRHGVGSPGGRHSGGPPRCHPGAVPAPRWPAGAPQPVSQRCHGGVTAAASRGAGPGPTEGRVSAVTSASLGGDIGEGTPAPAPRTWHTLLPVLCPLPCVPCPVSPAGTRQGRHGHSRGATKSLCHRGAGTAGGPWAVTKSLCHHGGHGDPPHSSGPPRCGTAGAKPREPRHQGRGGG